MIALIFLVTILDAVMLSTTGILPGIVFILVVALGLWRVSAYKSWYKLSLIYISLATLLYIFGGNPIDETVVHKLADWTLTFLLIGTIQLVRFDKKQ